MTRQLDESPAAGIVGPLLGFRDRPDTVFSAGGWIDPRGSLSHHYGHLEPMEQWAGREPQQVEWLDGSCQLIRAATLDDVGPYDEDYFLYWEEVAYHARAREHGWSVWCAPSAVAYQAPGDYRTYYGVRNKLRYLARHGRRRALLRSLLGSLRQARRDRVERPAVLRAVWDFVTGYGGPEPRSLRERNR
jgi:GT2 family glycosyltransferase